MPTRLVVQVTDTAFPKIMEIPLIKRVVLGRSDVDDTHSRPDIDLINCNAINNGISRRHAAIEVNSDNTYILHDLGSRNGTFINDVQIESNQSHPIQDGDKIRLGRLKMTIFFE